MIMLCCHAQYVVHPDGSSDTLSNADRMRVWYKIMFFFFLLSHNWHMEQRHLYVYNIHSYALVNFVL